MNTRRAALSLMTLVALVGFSDCTGSGGYTSGEPGSNNAAANPRSNQATSDSCQLVNSDFGPAGTTAVHTQAMVTGLNTPWDVLILPGGSGGSGGNSDWLVTERPGRLRLVHQSSSGLTLAPNPVFTADTVQSGEGGFLGLVADPQFQQNSFFYMYYTVASSGASTSSTANGGWVNRVQRFKLSADHTTATPDQVIFDNIPWNTVHNGGRIKIGPDGDLYISIGEGADATLPENTASVAGKILRVNLDGSIPSDNPQAGNPWWIKGLRNPQDYEWLDANTMIIADNGPTGEYEGRTGGDKILVASKGQDMGWPTIWHCESQAGLVSPILTWIDAVPPQGLMIYQGSEIPGWNGSVLVGSTGAEHLHRIVLNSSRTVQTHEVYLQGETAPALGRLRTVFQDPGGALYVTTSNCDSRGNCPATQDGIYRILPGN
jgi:aldose sugar dehydrogenase